MKKYEKPLKIEWSKTFHVYISDSVSPVRRISVASVASMRSRSVSRRSPSSRSLARMVSPSSPKSEVRTTWGSWQSVQPEQGRALKISFRVVVVF